MVKTIVSGNKGSTVSSERGLAWADDTRRRGLLKISLALIVGLLGSCASTSPEAGLKGSVTYTHPDRGVTLALITKAMLTQLGVPGDTPAEKVLRFHTEPRPSAAIKVCSDELFETLLLELENASFLQFVQPGHTQEHGGLASDGVIEVQLEGRVVHLVNVDETSLSRERKLTFTRSLRPILTAYNAAAQDQVVEGYVGFQTSHFGYRRNRMMRR